MESSTALADINPEKDGSQETIPSMSSQEILDFEKCLDNYSPALAGSQSESSVKSSVTITEEFTNASGQNKKPEGDGSALSSVFSQIDEKELSQTCGNAEARAHDEINSLFGTPPDTSITETKCAQPIVSQNVFDSNTQADSDVTLLCGALNKSCTNEICL